MTELTFLGRTGRWGDFHLVYSHGIVVRPIQEVYNRFPDVGQPAELTQRRIFDAVDSPWMILALGACDNEGNVILTAKFDRFRSRRDVVPGIFWN